MQRQNNKCWFIVNQSNRFTITQHCIKQCHVDMEHFPRTKTRINIKKFIRPLFDINKQASGNYSWMELENLPDRNWWKQQRSGVVAWATCIRADSAVSYAFRCMCECVWYPHIRMWIVELIEYKPRPFHCEACVLWNVNNDFRHFGFYKIVNAFDMGS